jgi:DnaK suppressor protein
MNIQKAKQVLLNKAKELASQTVSKDEIAIEPSAEMMDGLQNATDRVLALDILSRNWHTKLLVEEALQRVGAGTFGTCESCEESIPERRLEAIPWAKFCIRCQEAADNSREGDSELQMAA